MILIWSGFIAFVLLMLALDLGVFHRKARVVKIREALAWSGFWIALALIFGIFVYVAYENHWMGLGKDVDAVDGHINDGRRALLKYLTGYVVEKSLSVDNIFVFAVLFGFFAVPALHQHRVLFWGILGALVMRGAMIALGVELIARYHWILYVFGAFLILTAVKMLLMRMDHADPGHNAVVRLVKRWFPVTDQFRGERFFVRHAGRWAFTPLALTLVAVETTDLVFALDSIPAVFAVTADPFLVFTSNVFAILGLRAIYFALADMIQKFRYLKLTLAIVLAVVGLKMLLAGPLKALLGPDFTLHLLGLVLLILSAGVAASLIHARRAARRASAQAAGPVRERGPSDAAPDPKEKD
jgi:tellurite resistance protein TerC